MTALETERLPIGSTQQPGVKTSGVPAWRSDAARKDHLVSLRRRINALEAEFVLVAAEMGTAGTYEDDGAASAAAWLRHHCALSAADASDTVRSGRALGRMPLTLERFVAGVLDRKTACLLANAYNERPAAFERDEEMLLEQAAVLSVAGFRKALAYWRDLAADDVEDRARVQHERRKLFVSTTWDGMVRLDGYLDPIGRSTVIRAIGALSDSALPDDTDPRTPAQARADALAELARCFLDEGGNQVERGAQPHLTALVDIEVLEGRVGGTSELTDTGTVLTPEQARQLACEARISRIITRGRSEPLDVGRSTRVIPSPLRRALEARDRRCRAEGCDRPHRWCDAHHKTHWADGGETSLTNLILLCRRHHTMVHQSKRVAIRDMVQVE